VTGRLWLGLTLAWLLGFVGLGSVAVLDPLVRTYGPRVLAWWGG
jgi:hypothetical protein